MPLVSVGGFAFAPCSRVRSHTLAVNASPAVQWPPARSHKVKRCTTERVRRHHHAVRTRVCHTNVVHSR
jgi:hypothetical protein